VDILSRENVTLEIKGRHDPAIVHRARIVIDAVTAIAVYDILAGRFGTDYFAKEV
jgi:chorismate synthase